MIVGSSMKILAIKQFFWPDTAATGQLLGDVTFGLEGSPHRVTIVCGASDYGSVNDFGRAVWGG